MEIKDHQKYCIFAPLCKIMDKRESERLFKEINAEKRSFGIDLSYVTDCTWDFIDMLKKLSESRTVCLFNIPSDIFVIFNYTKADKFLNFYVNEQDFVSGCRTLINRQFKVI